MTERTARRLTETPFNERGRCRFCGTTPLHGRRTSWCSDDCVDGWKTISDPGYLRWKVRQRDKGVCALCGFDTGRLVRVLHRVAERTWRRGASGLASARRVAAWLNQKGFTVGADWKSVAYHSVVLWHADHIIPLAEGGTNAMANIRTLCVPCHKAETAALARRLAEARRLAAGKPVQIPLAEVAS